MNVLHADRLHALEKESPAGCVQEDGGHRPADRAGKARDQGNPSDCEHKVVTPAYRSLLWPICSLDISLNYRDLWPRPIGEPDRGALNKINRRKQSMARGGAVMVAAGWSEAQKRA